MQTTSLIGYLDGVTTDKLKIQLLLDADWTSTFTVSPPHRRRRQSV